jgi:hypothetical protein
MVTYKDDDSFFTYVTPVGSAYGLFSIFKWFANAESAKFRLVRDPEIENYRLNLQQVDELYPGCKTFAIVMNPWRRVYRAYKFSHLAYELNDNLQRNNETIDAFALDRSTFETFVKQLPNSKATSKYWFTPITQQYEWLEYTERTIDYVFKAETLDEDFKSIQEYFCNTTPLVFDEELPSYQEHYTEETKQIVSNLFAEDIKRFGYEF